MRPKEDNLIARLHSSESNEWYTPEFYIEAARRALGNIALDPASSAAAQKIVKADRYYSPEKEEDGLALAWRDRWYCNPPYGRRRFEGKVISNQKLWIEKAISEYEGSGRSGILLINSNTEAKYFGPAWRRYWKAYTNSRIRFDLPPGVPPRDQPTKGNVFVYFGRAWPAFAAAFSLFCFIVPPIPHFDNSAQYISDLLRTLGDPPF